MLRQVWFPKRGETKTVPANNLLFFVRAPCAGAVPGPALATGQRMGATCRCTVHAGGAGLEGTGGKARAPGGLGPGRRGARRRRGGPHGSGGEPASHSGRRAPIGGPPGRGGNKSRQDRAPCAGHGSGRGDGHGGSRGRPGRSGGSPRSPRGRPGADRNGRDRGRHGGAADAL